MPGDGTNEHPQGQSFLEAIANWRLALHTECKRSSSLPTSTFDACDPVLETRLAKTAEAMLAQLHDAEPGVAPDGDHADKRLETVTTAELRALPRRIAAEERAPSLLAWLGAEYFATLADTCCLATGAAQQRAVEMFCRDFAIAPHADLGQLTQLLAEQVEEVLAADGQPATDQELARTCKRIAAAVMLHAPIVAAQGPT